VATVERAVPAPRLTSADTLWTWVATVDHKRIGILYLLGAMVFLVIAGGEALLMRAQLAVPGAHVLSPDVYNKLLTMHGTSMVFLVGTPGVIGFANYAVPLMIGAHDMAFPRLNAMSLWLFILGGGLMHFSFLAGQTPDTGWFSYAPLTEHAFSPDPTVDYWILGTLIPSIGTIATAINLIVTVLTMRAPGMTIRRLPLFAWMMLITSFLIIWAFPPLTAGQAMLLVDRFLGGHFFNVGGGGGGGAPILWQHLFWAFGHPEVYILILPAFGILSEVVPVFSRKPLFGYDLMAAATVGIAFLSYLVWGHHMFATGYSIPINSSWGALSMLIAVPTGIKIFNYLATMWGGSLRLKTAMLWCIAFVSLFVIGGLSGVMLAAVPIDWQVTDSYFVVAHFHFVLIGGTVFGLFAGAYYWFPKMTGRLLSETLGRWHFGLFVLGFLITFVPMHITGLLGMPRRVYTYPPYPGWAELNMLGSIGAVFMAVGALVFLWNVISSLAHGPVAGDDPWDAYTLEWDTSSPPPPENFRRPLPPVRSRRPFWDQKYPDRADWRVSRGG